MGYDSRDYYRPSGFGGFSFFPKIIKNLLIINAVVFIFQMIFDSLSFNGVPGWYYLNRYFALNPITGIDRALQPYNFQIWQFFTYQFMHGSFTHILFNMFMLWMFGMEIENIMGSKKFLIYYLLCGVGAGIVQILFAPLLSDSLAPVIGASGAVYGIMIAFAMFFPERYIFLYFLIPIKAKYLIAFIIVIEFLSVGDASLVAHLAHIGGAITGFVFLLFDKKNSIRFDNLFGSIRKPGGFGSESRFRKPSFYNRKDNVEDAKFYEINNDKRDEEISQDEIDAILDKISRSGYQNLTEREKRILFEASKKK